GTGSPPGQEPPHRRDHPDQGPQDPGLYRRQGPAGPARRTRLASARRGPAGYGALLTRGLRRASRKSLPSTTVKSVWMSPTLAATASACTPRVTPMAPPTSSSPFWEMIRVRTTSALAWVPTVQTVQPSVRNSWAASLAMPDRPVPLRTVI